MAGSTWDKVLEPLTDRLKERLRDVKTNDIVEFCLKNEETRKVIEDYLNNHGKRKKSTPKNRTISFERKEAGSKKYKDKEYEESLYLYTESIYYADKNDECLPLAYSNRSLVLQQLGHISECLQDIDLALENGYPKDKWGKLILRKARCLIQLCEVDKAKEVLTEALRNNKTDCHQAIKKELGTLENYKRKQNSKSPGIKFPELIGGENEDFVSASKYLSVFYDQNKGRHVRATQDIKFGDVLFIEKPFAFVLFKDFCHKCCKKIIAPIPCWKCLDVSFCSPQCRDDFCQSVHLFECGFSELFKSVGIAHLSLRIILESSRNFDELKKILNNLEEPKYKDGIVSYRSSGYDSVFNLVHNSEKYETCDLFQYAMTALLLALYLKNYTSYFPNTSGDEDLLLLSSVLFRHILQLICNGHAIVDTFLQAQEVTTIFINREERIGTGIYPSASMMNHSCDPSVVYSFYNNCLIVHAARDIKKGEEVFNCYGPHGRRMTRRKRQEILSKQYFFKCECQLCLQKYDIQDIFTALKCVDCKGASVPVEENSIDLICLNCGRISKMTVILIQKQDLFYSLMEEGKILFNEDINSSLKKFLDCWWLGREIYYKFHKDLSYVADEVARCLAALRDFRRCVMFLKCSVMSVERRFGSHSIELGNEMKKLGDVIATYAIECEGNEARELAREGVACYQKSARAIGLFYCLQQRDSEEIRKNIEFLESLLKNN